MKILHTADWHIGTFRGPTKEGVNLRTEDTKRCLDKLIRVAMEERPDYSLISGDIFHVGRLWSDRCCEEIITAIHYIKGLAAASKHVVVMRGTPNHDGAGQFNVLQEMFSDCENVSIVTTPRIIACDDVDIAVLPGFDRGEFRAKFPGIPKEEENEVFTKELSNIVLGLKAQCSPNKPSILMSHYTVPGCNAESGQVMMLTQFEPIIPQETLQAANFDLVALGHIHRPQRIVSSNWYYSGAINAMNFNDEGQERGFWIHQTLPSGEWQSFFHNTPIREFVTLNFDDVDIAAINLGNIDEVAFHYWCTNNVIKGKIVRVHYSCSAENNKALNKAVLEKKLLDDGAFMVWEILPDKIDEFANRTELTNTTDPEANLIKYLEEKEYPPEKVQELVLKARPIISEAEASITTVVNTGTFEPVEISVKNYRNYEEETFSFENINFCTINGQNGAGKSSLFMDAIVDCIYEEPREGFVKDDNSRPVWLRDDEHARSGYIMFTFRIGDKLFRITRTRTRSGKITLNVAEFVDGEWQDRSKEKVNDTQQEILSIVGMDSLTFKSCALIMQDQYGLFLQAKPEERVEILGNLLGLGIYQIMEKIAADKGKVVGAKTRELHKEIEIHNSTIDSYGNPDAELTTCKAELADYEHALNAKLDEKDRNNLLLTHQQEAAERRAKLLQSITTLKSKKALAEQNRATQQYIIDSSSAILDNKQKIESMVAEYNSLLQREITLASESALYSAKKREAEEFARQEATELENINNLRARLKLSKNELSWAQPTEQDEVVRKNAVEYEKCLGLLHNAQELQMRYAEAVAEKERRAYAVDSKRAYINQEERRLNGKKADLERRTELLNNSGCIDAERAECKFLADALDAKKQLPVVENEIISFMQEQNELLQGLMTDLALAEKAVADIGFDESLLLEYKEKVSQLSGAPEALKKLEDRTSRIAVIQSDIEHLQSNILEAEKRLAEVKLKGKEATQERDRYARAFEEHVKVQDSLVILEPWLEKEKQLPVAAERKTTAISRRLELTTEISNIDIEISEKQLEAEKELLAMSDIGRLQTIVTSLETEVDALNAVIKGLQMKIGALQQKAEQISTLKKEIISLQKQQTEYAKETADYDALKVAFGQSGVPHQIIRSIIPQLTATSNSILGQMTSGKMGVEFKLERLQKNGKEKCSLDIFIEEYGKAALPYLSKSGGEKVKSSLSVILSLAEIKLSSAGIQLGMLFIDEPPFLDGDGIQAYCDALETIQSRYKDIKIMAITHDPTMKARFPQNLDVIKTEHGSKVIY